MYSITIQCESNPPGVFWHFFAKRLGIFSPNFTKLLSVPIYAGLQIFISLSVHFWRSYAILSTTTQSTPHVQNVHHRPKRMLAFSDTFPKQLGILGPNFTHLLRLSIYARLQIFIQLFPTVTKLDVLRATT